MGLLGGRTHLGQKKGGQKKRMRAQLNHSYLAVRIRADHAQFAVEKLGSVVRIQTIIAGKPLHHGGLAIEPMSQSVWLQHDGLGCAHQRTGQAADEQCGSTRRRFFVLGLGNP